MLRNGIFSFFSFQKALTSAHFQPYFPFHVYISFIIYFHFQALENLILATIQTFPFQMNFTLIDFSSFFLFFYSAFYILLNFLLSSQSKVSIEGTIYMDGNFIAYYVQLDRIQLNATLQNVQSLIYSDTIDVYYEKRNFNFYFNFFLFGTTKDVTQRHSFLYEIVMKFY